MKVVPIIAIVVTLFVITVAIITRDWYPVILYFAGIIVSMVTGLIVAYLMARENS